MKKESNILKVIIIVVVIIILILIGLVLFLGKKKTAEGNTITGNTMGTGRDINQIREEIANQIANIELPPNAIEYRDVSDEVIILKYLADYKDKVEKNSQRAYQLLDEEYREKRFGNLDGFNRYIQKNLTQIKQATIKKYQVKQKEGYTQYVCIDQFDNYYIFRETAVMQYTLLLDDYTIDIPEYIEKYNKSTVQEKTGLCIQRFLKAVNDESYTYAYGLLSQGFKNNYFKEQGTFEEYAKTVFKGKDKIEFGEFKNEGNIYSFTVTVTNSKDTELKTTKTFIVRLGEGTSFEMSFNM